VWGSVDSDRMVSPFSEEGFLIQDSDRYKSMNKPFALETEHLRP
jgi:hypothetical protein